MARTLLVLGLLAAVAAVMLGYHARVMIAGGKAMVMLAIIGGLVLFAVTRSRRGSRG